MWWSKTWSQGTEGPIIICFHPTCYSPFFYTICSSYTELTPPFPTHTMLCTLQPPCLFTCGFLSLKMPFFLMVEILFKFGFMSFYVKPSWSDQVRNKRIPPAIFSSVHALFLALVSGYTRQLFLWYIYIYKFFTRHISWSQRLHLTGVYLCLAQHLSHKKKWHKKEMNQTQISFYHF